MDNNYVYDIELNALLVELNKTNPEMVKKIEKWFWSNQNDYYL